MYRKPVSLHLVVAMLLFACGVSPAFGERPADVPSPPEDPQPSPIPELYQETPSTPPPSPGLRHPYPPVGFPGPEPRVTRVISLQPPDPPSPSDEPSPPQDFTWDPSQAPRVTPPEHVPNGETPSPAPQMESPSGSQPGLTGGGFAKAAIQPGTHVREFEGQDLTVTYPPDTALAVGSQHVVEVVNRGLTVYNKLGTEVQGYRSFDDFFSAPSGMSLFDPKIVWSPFHNKFAMLALARDKTAQDSRFYLAISQTPNALGDWWWWFFDAESLGDEGNWLDFASIGSDPFGVYVTGNMFSWGSGSGHTKLWAISPQAFAGGPANNWVWRNLEWPGGSKAKSPEVAHAHTQAWDEATFMVNTYDLSGSDALLWRIVGDRHTGAGLFLSRYVVNIHDHDALGGVVEQPGAAPLHGGRSVAGNAVYANRNVFFSLATDVEDDGSSAGLLTYRINVDTRAIEWWDLLWSGAGRYYIYPAVALRGSSPEGNLAVFYSYTSVPEGVHPASGFKFYDEQPFGDGGANFLYQGGLEPYVRLDGSGRNRWGDWSDASYDWQCGHLWGATEYAGTDNTWRTRIKAINGAGEQPCPGVSVVFPNGADQISVGSTHEVRWDASLVPPNAWIVVFYDDGRSIEAISPFLPPTATGFSWTVPDEAAPQARINVAAWDGERFVMSDWSDVEFAVVD